KPASATLPLTATASPPAALISAATASPGAASRSLTTSFAPSLASFSAMARPMPRPEPVTSATFPFSLDLGSLLSQLDDCFDRELDLAGLIFGGQRQPRALLAIVLHELGHGALAGQPGAEPRDRGKARREGADARSRHHIGQCLAEIGHHQHPVREHVGKPGLLGKIQIDMDRVVIARGAAIECKAVPGDRRKLLVDDALAQLWLCRTHDGLGLRMTTVREVSATCTPCWLVTFVSTTTSVIAPPFLSVTDVTRGRNVSTSPTTTGAK